MNGRVVALLAGIDAYVSPVNPLYGCVNDINALERYLRTLLGDRLDLRMLRNDEATRDAVTAGFREHLATAGPGDVALFAYCGHGSEELAPPEIAHLEPSGRIQTIVLHDCGRRIDGVLHRALADKELALLIAEAGAGGGHVVVILDCCNSGSGTRDPFVSVRGWTAHPDAHDGATRDLVAELAGVRPSTEFLPGTIEHWSAPAAPHVALSACRSSETAKEYRAGEVTRGAFSVALGEALDAIGPRATYRTLLATVGARVERSADEQHPELFPLDVGAAGDGLFLDGTVPPVAASFTVRQGAAGWRVDAGTVHGLRAPVGDEAFILACTAPDGSPAGMVRVTDVEIASAKVEPIDWTPDDVAYTAVVADVPLPPAEVSFDLPVEDVDPAALDGVRTALTEALATSGPGGGPSPHVRVVADGGTPTDGLRLRVGAAAAGVARLARADGSAITTDTTVADDAGARLAVARLEHVARWEQVRGLGGHASPLREAVVLDVYAAEEGETERPADRQPLPSGSGYRLAYGRADDGGWLAPRVFLELRNTTNDELAVAVLDLTDRYRCHPVLPTVRLAGGHTFSVADGKPLPVALPAGRTVEPGARVRDWIKVVVSDVDFDATAFDLPALDEPVAPRAGMRSARSALERLAGRAVTRDFDAGPPPQVVRWSASTIAVETVVP